MFTYKETIFRGLSFPPVSLLPSQVLRRLRLLISLSYILRYKLLYIGYSYRENTSPPGYPYNINNLHALLYNPGGTLVISRTNDITGIAFNDREHLCFHDYIFDVAELLHAFALRLALSLTYA